MTVQEESESVEVFLRGGLGNQLFQYAFGLFLSLQNRRALVLRTDLLPVARDSLGGVTRWPFQLGSFEFQGLLQANSHQPFEGTHRLSKVLQVERSIHDAFHQKLHFSRSFASNHADGPSPRRNLRGIRRVNGYAIDAKYALEIAPLLAEQIQNLKLPSAEFQKLSKELTDRDFLAVHLRLGDLTYSFREESFVQLSRRLRTEYRNSFLVLFTESRDQLMEISPKTAKCFDAIVDGDSIGDPVETLVVMAKSRYLVCAQSTFSWWAAFLQDSGQFVVQGSGALTNLFRDLKNSKP